MELTYQYEGMTTEGEGKVTGKEDGEDGIQNTRGSMAYLNEIVK